MELQTNILLPGQKVKKKVKRLNYAQLDTRYYQNHKKKHVNKDRVLVLD